MHPTWTWVTPPVEGALGLVCVEAWVQPSPPPVMSAGSGSTTCTVVLSWDACWIWTSPSQCDVHGAAWTWVIVCVVVFETAD
jgi:hypothetical protein